MFEYPPLQRWNDVHLELTQALLGSISSNVRAISLSFESDQWMVRFTLAEKNDEDIEWLGEALTDWEAMDPSVAPYRFEYLTSQEKIESPPPPGRLVFRRRE